MTRPRKVMATTRADLLYRRAARRNKAFWEKSSVSYERTHARALKKYGGMAWGFWRVPERRLRLLGDVRGKKILELGCGAARWSLALSRMRAIAVGIDTSWMQLRHALRVLGKDRARVSLFRASAETLPFKDGTFDIAFCDFGALTFADPERAIPEASRVLRPGGRLVFAQSSPIRFLFEVETGETISSKLQRDYFSLGWLRFPETTERALTYSGWIHLFRESGLVVEDLLETRPGPSDRSSYLNPREERWARRWPLECLWSLRKGSSSPPSHAASPAHPESRRRRRELEPTTRQGGQY